MNSLFKLAYHQLQHTSQGKETNNESEKMKQYDTMKTNQHISVDGTLSLFSTKSYEIMKRIQLYVEEGKPTGKVLYYSDFRQDSGSEAFEQILQVDGSAMTDGRISVKFSVLNSSKNSMTGTCNICN